MLKSCRFYIVGLQFLLLSHIAHTFVLTVDVDDLKKIARKFVTESLADKISDFVFRATKNIVANTKISQENESYGDDKESAISQENEMQSIKRLDETSQHIESIENKPESFARDEAPISKISEEESKRHEEKNENVEEEDILSILTEKLKATRPKNTIPREQVNLRTGFNVTEDKVQKDEISKIKIPDTKSKQFIDLKRSKADVPIKTRETTTEFDLFDMKVYKTTEKEDMSAHVSEKDGDVNWWEKELPHKGYDNVKVEENVYGK